MPDLITFHIVNAVRTRHSSLNQIASYFNKASSYKITYLQLYKYVEKSREEQLLRKDAYHFYFLTQKGVEYYERNKPGS